MKAVLVIDMPNNCSECPCCNERECGNQYKGYVGDYLGWNSGKPSWCPLKPLPNKWFEDGSTSYAMGIARGFNKCIDKITGETE